MYYYFGYKLPWRRVKLSPEELEELEYIQQQIAYQEYLAAMYAEEQEILARARQKKKNRWHLNKFR